MVQKLMSRVNPILMMQQTAVHQKTVWVHAYQLLSAHENESGRVGWSPEDHLLALLTIYIAFGLTEYSMWYMISVQAYIWSRSIDR